MDLKIVEYEKKYAASLADMWNKSADNWGGADETRSAEDIIMEKEHSSTLNIFLALDGTTVIGYCSLSEYEEDERALYIPLLNVRPDYHGKKVGKALVLKAVERTIELDWPRLDLYTWPGNIKAVPLYKKSGFFWEKRKGTTHLMNFIPTVLNMEALKDFFEKLDWYNDSQRAIEVKPDGTKEDDFCFYEYRWQNEETFLRTGFEKRSRGLRLIETDDYLIKAYLDEYELVFGRKYKVYYQIKNKTNNKLDIELQGLDDKNIKFNWQKKILIKDETIISADFYLDKITEKQRTEKTHPSVTTLIKIKGQKALFKLGVKPKFPADIKLTTLNEQNFLEQTQKCFLTIKNCYQETAEFVFKLPDSEKISFSKRKINIELSPEEKTTIKLNYILHDYFVLNEPITVNVFLKNSKQSFQKKLYQIFKGEQGLFGGEIEQGWVICNGNYSVTLNKHDNQLYLQSFYEDHEETFISFPRLGKPFSLEFSKKDAAEVSWEQKDNDILLTALYKSTDFTDILLKSITVLKPNGLIKHYYQLINNSTNISQEITLADCFFHNLNQGVIPYNDQIVSIKDTKNNHLQNFDLNLISENWMFSQDENRSRGISWPENKKIILSDWIYSIRHDIGKLKGQEKVTTEPLIISIGTYSDWKSFRQFALQKQKPQELPETTESYIKINQNNPVLQVENNTDVIFKDLTNADLTGKLEISSSRQSFLPVQEKVSRKENNILAQTKFNVEQSGLIDLINLKLDLSTSIIEQQQLFFTTNCDKTVKNTKKKVKNHKIFQIDNGCLTFKLAPDFSHALYSLRFKGHEWLDNSFPKPGPKGWWNPWSGGIFIRPGNIEDRQLLAEKKEVEFTKLKDNQDNTWSGIKITINITENKEYEGLSYSQFFLTLPELPVLVSLTEINQNTGNYYQHKPFNTIIFLKPGEKITNNRLQYQKKGELQLNTFKTGKIERHIKTKSPLLFGSTEREEKLLIYQPGPEPHCSASDNQIINVSITEKISAEDGATVYTKPIFIFFYDKYLPTTKIQNLKYINFSGN